MQYAVKTESKVKGAYEQQVKGTKFPVLVVQNLDVNDGIIIQNKEVKKNSVKQNLALRLQLSASEHAENAKHWNP